MNLKLDRPLAFFDLESTSLNISDAKIVSLSVLKIMPDGSFKSKSVVLNPKIPIPKAASDIHGITDNDVKDKHSFKDISKSLLEYLKGCDIGGHNINNYDVPLLSEEFSRCQLDWPELDVKIIDTCNIFKKKEGRDLASALKFYCNKELEDAHSSSADTTASKDVFLAQLEKYEELQGKSIEEIHEFCKMDTRVDLAGKIIKDADGDYIYAIGKSKGVKMKNDLGFAEWMLAQDFFTKNTKDVILKIKEEIVHNKNLNKSF